MEQRLLTPQQAEQRLDLSRHQLTRLRISRKIGFFKKGGRIFYSPEEVERVLKSFEVPAIRPVICQLESGEDVR